MAMRNRLRRSEKEAIRSKYAHHPVYLALRNPATLLCDETRFRLSAEELFLWCMAEMDELKRMPTEYTQRARVLVSDLRNDLRDMSEDGVTDGDIVKAASEVAFVLTILLAAHGSMAYARIISELTMQISTEETNILHRTFMPELWRTDGENYLHEYMQEYMDSDECLSGDIGKILIAVEDREVANTPVVSLAKSSLCIPTGKMTSVLVVLNAMFKAGWFAKSDGSKVTNRDNTLNEILQLAFNRKGNENISQLLNAAKNRNCKEFEDYFKELKDAVKP